MGVKLQQEIFRLDPKDLPQCYEPLEGRMGAPMEVTLLESGGVPVRVKDAAVARQRPLFPLRVWL